VRSGRLLKVTGPMVLSRIDGVAVQEMVEVGPRRLPGEVLALNRGIATVQVFDYTGGLRPGDDVVATGEPLSVPLGPGLLGGVFDGALQPLSGAADRLESGPRPPSAPTTWDFTPEVEAGAQVSAGTRLGVVKESIFEHVMLVPPGIAGRVDQIAPAGSCPSSQALAVIGSRAVGLSNRWPVRRPRPARERLRAGAPIITGQRVLDILYPIAKGSTAAVPGGFGTGKTVLLQQVAKWCDADVIVYVGCGERGNEMADVLSELPLLQDPRTGRSLMERTVVIANTSNMPVMAREASIYTGVTVGEYFRDMGLDVVVIADSTSRWAEALREFAARAGEMPAEEGFPATLSSALAAFYERAGVVTTLGGETGSLSIIGAVSPPGGDFTEPVTAHTARFVRSIWSLDRDLAYARHYPAVNWHDSFSRDSEVVRDWHAANGDSGWGARRARLLDLLAESDRLESIAQLIGATGLPDRERIVMLTARLIRQSVLQQSSLSVNDAYCGAAKEVAMVESVLAVHDAFLSAVTRGVPAVSIEELDLSSLVRAREESLPTDGGPVEAAALAIVTAVESLQ